MEGLGDLMVGGYNVYQAGVDGCTQGIAVGLLLNGRIALDTCAQRAIVTELSLIHIYRLCGTAVPVRGMAGNYSTKISKRERVTKRCV